ncbi:Nicotinamide nucleotide repair protein [Thiorhodovibrio winogradskyi]|uniref:Bifunctional NAD(P)H-hydrate repair enzyme n=1 Tax=Thiorhodovibrio winogradskyi TaxID=77007 RepID=A0ABZ0SDE5_9GAMM|nr:NAD(P)H-hydrate dehydratase [Thiorhodovibrio winogradskyi]
MARLMPCTDRLPYALYRAGQVRMLDACAIERFGIPGETLMERAGTALWRLIQDRWPQAGRLTILAGPGNNGGDGYVVARLAHRAGRQVRLVRLGDHSRLSGAAATAAAAYAEAGGRVATWPAWPDASDLILDALLGTGLTRAVTGDMAAAIRRVNQSRAPVLAVDIPSGLSADTGQILGDAIHATLTLSFIGLKQGLFTGDGPDCVGDVRFDALEVPAAVYASTVAAARRTDWPKEASRIPPRPRSAHKGHCGHVLVVGGAPGMSGAARLCGEAALRTGAGLVRVATHPEHAALLNLTRPELMVAAISTPDQLAPLLEQATVVALGPGLGRDPWGRALFEHVLQAEQSGPRPLVLDADALNLLAEQPGRRDNWILTPHPGEAARLLACTTADIAQDRFAAATQLQQGYGGTVVLKGAGTLITSSGQPGPALCSQGNPGMASGGMGDALTGIIGALLAQGLDLEQAASAGVCLHAAAADWAARKGERGLLASDLIAALRRQWRRQKTGESRR